MPSTYVSIHVHIVFATKDRRPLLSKQWRDRLFAYMGGTLKGMKCHPEAIGGVEDHVHILVGIPATACVSDVVRDLKRASNSWIHDIIGVADFQWQVGYAALSANANGRDGLHRYINGQEEHHRHQSSLDELRDLLDQAGVTIDERYFD